MHIPVPVTPPTPTTEPSALAQAGLREDVQWNRRIFKAPPLEMLFERFDVSAVLQDLRRVGLAQR